MVPDQGHPEDRVGWRRWWYREPPANELNPQTYPRDPTIGHQRGCPTCRYNWFGCARCLRPEYRSRVARPDTPREGGMARGNNGGKKK
jgi:hypothetical protein